LSERSGRVASIAASAKGAGAAADLPARVAAQLAGVVQPGARVVVGLSGGVDSVVLLDCLRHAARRLRFRLCALHVNHGLSPHAKRWEDFCRRLCRARGIPFTAVRVRVPRSAPEGVEAAARAARYAALCAARADYVALAHHQDDQAETLLLQLLRGAGVKGLAAMPLLRRVEEAGRARRGKSGPSASPTILRPLLDAARREILEYAKRRNLKWIEDESNADLRRARNFLRHRVLPLIEQRFPAYRATLARAARHLADAAELLDEVAAADAALGLEQGTLAVQALRRLGPARARNLLRHFLALHAVSMPPAERLAEALRQALVARQDARVAVDLGGAILRRYGGRLYVTRELRALPAGYEKRWRGEREIALPELGGTLMFERTRGDGVSLARVRGHPLLVRVRRGGERLRPDCRRPTRTLRNLLQEARIPPWERDRLPLLFCGKDLVWAAGIGVDCAYRAARGESALRPVWKRCA
jgi:tRNA(Ile)-lysidine synthase